MTAVHPTMCDMSMSSWNRWVGRGEWLLLGEPGKPVFGPYGSKAELELALASLGEELDLSTRRTDECNTVFYFTRRAARAG